MNKLDNWPVVTVNPKGVLSVPAALLGGPFTPSQVPPHSLPLPPSPRSAVGSSVTRLDQTAGTQLASLLLMFFPHVPAGTHTPMPPLHGFSLSISSAGSPDLQTSGGPRIGPLCPHLVFGDSVQSCDCKHWTWTSLPEPQAGVHCFLHFSVVVPEGRVADPSNPAQPELSS